MLLQLREPWSAGSHGAGMILAVGLTWIFWRLCTSRDDEAADAVASAFERGKRVAMMVFGFSLVFCYGSSALYHAAPRGELMARLRRLDHLGIYLLIAGTYTPGVWALMRGFWRKGTLGTVWGVAAICGGRVWFGGVFPPWASTLIYLGMGWGVLFCYRELARSLSHRTLSPLPLGGVLYSIGALINLAGWPAFVPGVFGAHELFHVFVIAGSACHVYFMLHVVIPARLPGERVVPDATGWPTVLNPGAALGSSPRPGPSGWRLAGLGSRISREAGEVLFHGPYLFLHVRPRGARSGTEAVTPAAARDPHLEPTRR